MVRCRLLFNPSLMDAIYTTQGYRKEDVTNAFKYYYYNVRYNSSEKIKRCQHAGVEAYLRVSATMAIILVVIFLIYISSLAHLHHLYKRGKSLIILFPGVVRIDLYIEGIIYIS